MAVVVCLRLTWDWPTLRRWHCSRPRGRFRSIRATKSGRSRSGRAWLCGTRWFRSRRCICSRRHIVGTGGLFVCIGTILRSLCLIGRILTSFKLLLRVSQFFHQVGEVIFFRLALRPKSFVWFLRLRYRIAGVELVLVIVLFTFFG